MRDPNRMRRSFHRTLLLLLAFTLGCVSVPIALPWGRDKAASTPTAEGLTPGETAIPAPSSLIADSISEIPLHSGYGVRGPWFEIYFTDPANPVSAQLNGGVDEHLVAAIDAARLTVHAALYSLTLNDVRDALVRAHRRGVDVRVVTESDNLDSQDLQRLVDSGIPVLGDRRESTMHNKFMVVDGTEVWTGSMNFTVSGAYSDNNTLIRLESAQLGADYETEFSEMFEDDKFGEEPGRPTPNPQIEIDGTRMEVYFSPDDGVESALADLIGQARGSVYFLAYSFTSNRLGEAILRAAASGVTVKGVMDEDQSNTNLGTELTAFRAEGLDARLDGSPGQMHEKVFIIDEEIVVVGSYNFSRSASEFNDENVLVIHNRPIAEQFLREFQRVYGLASK
jgi:phosphatidylserine/phosphatidylglycerophosphate/cardiolipin synthase-like enzyme